MDACIGWMDGWIDGWLGGWMDESNEKRGKGNKDWEQYREIYSAKVNELEAVFYFSLSLSLTM